MGNSSSRRYGDPFYYGPGTGQSMYRRNTFNGSPYGQGVVPPGAAMHHQMLAANGMMVPGMTNSGYMANGGGPVLPPDAFQAAQNGYPSYQYQPEKRRKKKKRSESLGGIAPRAGWESGYVSGLLAGMGVNGAPQTQAQPQPTSQSYNSMPQTSQYISQQQQPQFAQAPQMSYGRSASFPPPNGQGPVMPPIPQVQSQPNPTYTSQPQSHPDFYQRSQPPPQMMQSRPEQINPVQSMPINAEPQLQQSFNDPMGNPTPYRIPNPLPRAPREVLDSPRYATIRDLLRSSRSEGRRATRENGQDREVLEERMAQERMRERDRERDRERERERERESERIRPGSRASNLAHGRRASESVLAGPYSSATVRQEEEQASSGRGLFGFGGRKKGKGRSGGFLNGFVSTSSNNAPPLSQPQDMPGPSIQSHLRPSLERRRNTAPDGRRSPVMPYGDPGRGGLHADVSNVIPANAVFVPADSLPGGVSPRLPDQSYYAHQTPHQTPQFGAPEVIRSHNGVPGPYRPPRSPSSSSQSDDSQGSTMARGYPEDMRRRREGPAASYLTPGPPPSQMLSPNGFPSHLSPHSPVRPPASLASPSLGPVHMTASNPFRDLLPTARQHKVLFRNVLYFTAQHLYEALKFIDTAPDLIDMLRDCPLEELPQVVASALARGRAFPGWEAKREEMMETALTAKFEQHPHVRAQLLETGERPLVFADSSDAFWGLGPDSWGQNRLGQILMEVRRKLRTVTDAMPR